MKLFSILNLLLIPTVAFAAATSEEGNKPLSAANYTDWPNLVEAINDESRVFQMWVNGNESFYYSGDSEAANRVLKEFSETEFPGLQVILLPGPPPETEVFGKKISQNFRINIMGGIARAFIQRGDLKRIYMLQPTMTIYISSGIELSKLKIPTNLKLLQLVDLENHYRKGLDDESDEVKKTAQRQIDQLNKEFQRKGEEYKQLEKQISEINKYVMNLKSAQTRAE